jgi:uracil-DNA glycosylase
VKLYAGERNNTSKIAEVEILSNEPTEITNTPVLKLCPKCRKPTAT